MKTFIFCLSLTVSTSIYSQVNTNTENPQVTLDIISALRIENIEEITDPENISNRSKSICEKD